MRRTESWRGHLARVVSRRGVNISSRRHLAGVFPRAGVNQIAGVTIAQSPLVGRVIRAFRVPTYREDVPLFAAVGENLKTGRSHDQPYNSRRNARKKVEGATRFSTCRAL
jgi:hypothetical protein